MQRRVLDAEVDGGKRVAHGVKVDVCSFYGEQLYDRDAVHKIETACPIARRRRSATERL